MGDEKYNGWTNYETWCMSLWFDNDEGSYEQVRYITSKTVQNIDEPDPFKWELSENLRSYAEELAEMTCPALFEGGSFVLDFFNAAMSEVDWHEIAENLIDELVNA